MAVCPWCKVTTQEAVQGLGHKDCLFFKKKTAKKKK